MNPLHSSFGQAVALWQAFYRSSYTTLYSQPKLTDHDPDDDDVSADGDDQHEGEQDGPDDLQEPGHLESQRSLPR